MGTKESKAVQTRNIAIDACMSEISGVLTVIDERASAGYTRIQYPLLLQQGTIASLKRMGFLIDINPPVNGQATEGLTIYWDSINK